MKGFIHLVEVAVAAILITIVLGAFLAAQNVKLSWERSDLVDIGNSVFYVLDANDKILETIENPSDINELKPSNVEFGLRVSGIPKTNITVACPQQCSKAYDILTPAYLNGRWFKFDIKNFDISGATYIPQDYDAIILIDFTDYPSEKGKIQEFIEHGGVVIGINDTYSDGDNDFNEIYGLVSTSGSGTSVSFSEYNPTKNEIGKYFLGIGMDIDTPYYEGGKQWGLWHIWGNSLRVNSSSSGYTEIKGVGVVNEGEKFVYNGHNFKVKKIFWPSKVMIQALDSDFSFNDFSEENVKGINYNILMNSGDQFAAMTTNGTAIWMSNFDNSDEYRTLVKAALASTVNDWYVKKTVFPTQIITSSFFKPMCCDASEIAELTLILWYSY